MNDSKKDMEFEAMLKVYEALEALDETARSRVVEYVADRLGIAARRARGPEPGTDDEEGSDAEIARQEKEAPVFGSFAELYAAAQPNTNADRALVAGYWAQVCRGEESFEAYGAHKELKNVGEHLANITLAFNALKDQRPALVLQLSKSGKSAQARKTYKLTVPGIKRVEEMFDE